MAYAMGIDATGMLPSRGVGVPLLSIGLFTLLHCVCPRLNLVRSAGRAPHLTHFLSDDLGGGGRGGLIGQG